MDALWIGLALTFAGALLIGIAAERLRRRLRQGSGGHSTPHSLWRKLFRGPRA